VHENVKRQMAVDEEPDEHDAATGIGTPISPTLPGSGASVYCGLPRSHAVH
jgi:hypothetical protein